MNACNKVIVGAVSCDWVTLTSKVDADVEVWRRCLGWALPEGGPIRYMRRMQYRGDAGHQWFVGEGEQEGAAHWMAQVSGSLADAFVSVLALTRAEEYRDKATRYDLQLTLPLRDETAIRRAATILLSGEKLAWKTRGRPPRVSCHLNDEGLDTLYVGTRDSTKKFMRAYVKDAPDGRFLRVEVEFKGDAANECLRLAMKGSQKGLEAALAGEMARMPEEVAFLFQDHLDAIQTPPARLVIDAEDPTEERTFRWLETTVLHAAGRMAGSVQRSRLVDWMNSVVDVVAGQ